MININQTLHGYANGHQMLATSCEWTLDERKKLDTLSDLNGQCDEKKFKDYYTGYPIAGGTQYVIAKTWYAAEMERPGCVWTHSLILSIEDIARIQSVDDLLELFVRPSSCHFDGYKRLLQLEIGEFENTTQIDKEVLEYYIYTVYGFSRPRLVCFEADVQESLEEFFMCLRFMPVELLREFSFCTMVYGVRTYGGNIFPYQITTEELAYSIKRRNTAFEICPPFKSVEKYPFWVNAFLECARNSGIKTIRKYILLYEKDTINWENYNGFLRLYFMLSSRDDLCLQDYFESLSFVFPKCKDALIQETINSILDNKFFVYDFDSAVYDILEMLGMKKFRFKINGKQRKGLVEQYLHGDLKMLYSLLCKYKEGKLNSCQREIVEEIVTALKPTALKTVSKMDEDLCVVLVRINPKLLLSKDIWKTNRDFQIMLLYAGGGNVDSQLLPKLIERIIHTSEEDVVNECYQLYGDRLLTVMLDILKKDVSGSEKCFEKWLPIFIRKPEEVMNALEEIGSEKVCKMLFFAVNKKDREFLQRVSPNIWGGLYKRILEGEKDKNERKKLALEFLVVIFSVDYRFDTDMVDGVIHPIYDELLEDILPANEWNFFQYLLPQVEVCYSWDKCRRVREALQLRGYSIQGINI